MIIQNKWYKYFHFLLQIIHVSSVLFLLFFFFFFFKFNIYSDGIALLMIISCIKYETNIYSFISIRIHIHTVQAIFFFLFQFMLNCFSSKKCDKIATKFEWLNQKRWKKFEKTKFVWEFFQIFIYTICWIGNRTENAAKNEYIWTILSHFLTAYIAVFTEWRHQKCLLFCLVYYLYIIIIQKRNRLIWR